MLFHQRLTKIPFNLNSRYKNNAQAARWTEQTTVD